MTVIRFIAVFAVLILFFFAIELTRPAQIYFVLPWTAALTSTAAFLLQTFDGSVIAAGKVLANAKSGFSVSVEAGCNGIEAVIVLLAAMLAFPAPWRYKLLGIVAGALTIQVMNLVRVISLFYIGQWSLSAFEWMHLYVWQALIMLDVLVVWLVWIRMLPRDAYAASGSAAPPPTAAPVANTTNLPG
jgi:exosortase H (IPTLxxWG-CTERM-specific)